jgi:diguanylate cyclase (GGDEF)-like protein/PAS domain S-box-containing protein
MARGAIDRAVEAPPAVGELAATPRRDPDRYAALVVDGDATQRRRTRDELEAAGFRVEEAGSEGEALLAIRRRRPALVILDASVQERAGYETCQSIRRDRWGRDLPILVVTASDDSATVERAFEVGASDFAAKPVQWPLLRHRARFLARAGDALSRLQAAAMNLAERERRLSEAESLAHIGSWEWRVERDLMVWSEEAFRILGRDSQSQVPSYDALRESVHPDDRSRFEDAVQRAAEARGSFSLEHRLRGPDGRVRFVHHQGAVDSDPSGGGTRVLGTLQDVTERRRNEDRMVRLAYFDSLTGLPNRRLLHDRLERTLRFAQQHGRQIALLFVDVDKFKWVNDSLGHAAGDALLKEVAARLVDSLRLEDGVFRPSTGSASRFLSRVGGDEFVVTLLLGDEPSVAAKVAQRLLGQLSRTFALGGKEIAVTASIGIAVFPKDASDAQSLLQNADLAMYHAKSGGRNRFQFYAQDLSSAAKRALSIQAGLRRAIEQGGFRLFYQPEVATRSGRVGTFEALLRWDAPGEGPVAPVEFIRIAEDSGLVWALGKWVLRRACQDCSTWQRNGLAEVGVAVNLSSHQLRRPEIVELVADTLRETGLAPGSLELELTETALLDDTPQVAQSLEDLKGLGVRLALDDFGTGYASLSYLKRIPFDSIKIDREFVRDIGTDAGDRAIIAAIIAIARTFGLRVIAEGVETELHEQLVRQEHCDAMQGYWVGRPAPVEEIAELHARATRPPVWDARD